MKNLGNEVIIMLSHLTPELLFFSGRTSKETMNEICLLFVTVLMP